MHHLKLCRSRLKQVDTIRAELHHKLKEILEILKKEAQVTLEDYFLQEEYERADFFRNLGRGARIFFDLIKGKHYNSSRFEFETVGEKEEFENQAIAYAKQRLERSLEAAREDATKQVEKSLKALFTFFDIETKEIIERARTRLNKAFYVDLFPPPIPDWNIGDEDFAKTSDERQTREQKKYKKVKERPWYFLWMIKIESTVEVTSEEDYYVVYLEEIVKNVNKGIERSIKNIDQAINQYLDEDFKQRVDAFFNSLDRYLSNYRDSLEQAQKDQKLKADQKNELVNKLNFLVTETNEKIRKAETYLEYIKNLRMGK